MESSPWMSNPGRYDINPDRAGWAPVGARDGAGRGLAFDDEIAGIPAVQLRWWH